VKDTIHGGEPTVVARREHSSKKRARCSICRRRIWFDGTPFMEPVGVPEPRRSWILCQQCHAALLIEMRRSPIRSPLRLRIAMGLVAAERSPQAYKHNPSLMSDHAWILVIAWGFAIAMILHLILIVLLAYAR